MFDERKQLVYIDVEKGKQLWMGFYLPHIKISADESIYRRPQGFSPGSVRAPGKLTSLSV